MLLSPFRSLVAAASLFGGLLTAGLMAGCTPTQAPVTVEISESWRGIVAFKDRAPALDSVDLAFYLYPDRDSVDGWVYTATSLSDRLRSSYPANAKVGGKYHKEASGHRMVAYFYPRNMTVVDAIQAKNLSNIDVLFNESHNAFIGTMMIGSDTAAFTGFRQ